MAQADCIFCRITAGDVPAAKVYEDESCLAFMDIGPVAEGHVLLIPKAHYETVDTMPADVAGSTLRNVPALVSAVKQALGCEGVNVLQNNGKVAHQEVMHVHFHIIPRTRSDNFGFNWPAATYPEGRAEQLARSIRQAMGS